MEANEAPEKLYIQPDAQDCWFMINNLNNTLVEYTRTDAFIEKACEWLNKESESYVKTGGVGACVTYEGLDVKELVEDFEKYMEGE